MKREIITVTLNPCIDKTIELCGFCEGGLNRAVSVRVDAGGKGINVAKVLGYFGAKVVAVGVLGNGGSDGILEELKHRGIRHDFVLAPGETRTNYKLFDNEKRQITEINEPGFAVDADKLEQTIALIEKHLSDAAVMVLAGSVAPGIPKDIYRHLTHLAAQHEVQVILDADGQALVAGLEAKPFVIKPNLYELEQLHGGSFESDEALYAYGRELIAGGVGLIVLSMGGNGAVYMTKEAGWRVKLAPIVCQSTVGAGDSMVAATAYSLAEGASLEELAKTASAAGTVTASKPGTEVCRLEEVLAYREKLSLERIW